MAEGLVVAGEALVVVGATFKIVPAASHSLIRRTIRPMGVHNRDAGSIELTVHKTVDAGQGDRVTIDGTVYPVIRARKYAGTPNTWRTIVLGGAGGPG